MEIAAWPHIVEKIPDPPRFPGFSNSSSSSRKSKNSKSANAGDEDIDDCPVEEAISVEDKNIQMLHERETSVISELALQERWRVPLPRISTKWISPLRESFSSRKSAWDRAVELCLQEVTIDKALLGVGGNGKPLKATSLSRKTVLEAGRLRFNRDGLWVVGQEEEWQRGRPLLDSTETDALKPSSQNRRLTGLAYFLQSKRKEHRDLRLREMMKPKLKLVSYVMDLEFEGHYGNLNHVQRLNDNIAEPQIEASFSAKADLKQELHKSCSTANALIKGGEEKEAADDTCELSHILGKASEASNGESLHSQIDNGNEQHLSKINEKDLGLKTFVGDSVLENPGVAAVSGEVNACIEPQSLKPPAKAADDKVSFTLREAETELRFLWKKLPEEERKDWEFRAAGLTNETEDSSTPLISQSVPSSPSHDDNIMLPLEAPIIDAPSEASSSRIVTPSCSQNSSCASPCRGLEERKGTHDENKIGCSLAGHSKNFCLNEDQIKMCYEACVTHYEQIMRTVRVRDLERELQGGFDLFRERGRGRFDMELPIFETIQFGFLTDLKKAPWMTVVKEILGNEVCLIHKGIFLAMPDAEKQSYHQDGIHLTSQYQKPCHAINVFVPLVDLTNQGTEFCLGSQILGNEDLDSDFLYTPSVAAGTPIVFDYRLGHRGLANTRGTIRPVVYCTYAAAANGNEFRDSVNFSRKRYKPIGDLVSKAPSREERAKKRGKTIIESLEPTELPLSPSQQSN